MEVFEMIIKTMRIYFRDEDAELIGKPQKSSEWEYVKYEFNAGYLLVFTADHEDIDKIDGIIFYPINTIEDVEFREEDVK